MYNHLVPSVARQDCGVVTHPAASCRCPTVYPVAESPTPTATLCSVAGPITVVAARLGSYPSEKGSNAVILPAAFQDKLHAVLEAQAQSFGGFICADKNLRLDKSGCKAIGGWSPACHATFLLCFPEVRLTREPAAGWDLNPCLNGAKLHGGMGSFFLASQSQGQW